MYSHNIPLTSHSNVYTYVRIYIYIPLYSRVNRTIQNEPADLGAPYFQLDKPVSTHHESIIVDIGEAWHASVALMCVGPFLDVDPYPKNIQNQTLYVCMYVCM